MTKWFYDADLCALIPFACSRTGQARFGSSFVAGPNLAESQWSQHESATSLLLVKALILADAFLFNLVGPVLCSLRFYEGLEAYSV